MEVYALSGGVCVSADVNMCSGQDVLQFDATYTNANFLVLSYI